MNKTGRPTTDKKEQALKIRMNDAARAWVEQRSQEEGVSMSEFIRFLIEMDKLSIEELLYEQEMSRAMRGE